MSREEAIKYLNEFILFKKISNITEEEAVECFELAVEALEQQPNEDCISRQAVLESLHKRFADGFDGDKWWNSTVVLYAISETPPVTPQQKTEGARGDIPLQQSVPEMPQPKTEQESFEDCIRKSVIVHPKKGHWIGDNGATVYVNSEGNLADFIACKCSECGEWLTGSDEYVCGGRFCPSCGIKMEEKNNERKTESEEI